MFITSFPFSLSQNTESGTYSTQYFRTVLGFICSLLQFHEYWVFLEDLAYFQCNHFSFLFLFQPTYSDNVGSWQLINILMFLFQEELHKSKTQFKLIQIWEIHRKLWPHLYHKIHYVFKIRFFFLLPSYIPVGNKRLLAVLQPVQFHVNNCIYLQIIHVYFMTDADTKIYM